MAAVVASSFDALREMHDSANDLLHSPMTRRAIVRLHQEKWVHEISEASLRMLDACGTTKDVLLHVKDHLQDLQSTFRRVMSSSGDHSSHHHHHYHHEHHHHHGNKFGAYSPERKKLKKEMLKRLHSLKGMKNRCISDQEMYPIDHNLMVVVSVLREVRLTTMSIVESLMSLMSLMSMPTPTPSKMKLSRGIFAGKLLMRVDSITLWDRCDTTTLQSACKRLEAVEIAIEDLEVKLECMFRRLIRTRVSLLNILTN